MARGSKDYDKKVRGKSGKSAKEKQKTVWGMVGAKKKLREMLESLIAGDTKNATDALHAYLQVKTRVLLGEADDSEFEGSKEDMGDLEGSSEEDMDDGDGEDHDDEEDMVAKDHDEDHDDEEDMDDDEDHVGDDMDDMDDEHGDEDHDEECPECHGEGCPKCKPSDEEHMSESAKMTHMHKHGNSARGLESKVKGNLKYKTNGTARNHIHPNSAPHLNAKSVKKFPKGGKKGNKNHILPNTAKQLAPKVKGTVKY